MDEIASKLTEIDCKLISDPTADIMHEGNSFLNKPASSARDDGARESPAGCSDASLLGSERIVLVIRTVSDDPADHLSSFLPDGSANERFRALTAHESLDYCDLSTSGSQHPRRDGRELFGCDYFDIVTN
jgi:hypothetical protein